MPQRPLSPHLYAEWHPTKNGNLRLENGLLGHKYWWRCLAKNYSRCQSSCEHPHEWESLLSNRIRGDGCPWCSFRGAVLCPCQSLEARRPDLAAQWHYEKNGDLLPGQVSVYSAIKVFWKCTSRPPTSRCRSDCTEEHVWKSTISHRATGRGCPWCVYTGKFLCPCQTLEVRRPDVAAQWHYKKNGDLLPSQVSVYSKIKVFWKCTFREPTSQCRADCTQEHVWEARIDHRARTSGCPWCAHGPHGLCPCQSLEARRPDLAAQWHYEKNGDILPSQVSAYSKTRVYWVCTSTRCTSRDRPHVWQAKIRERAGGAGCPRCNGNRAEARLEEILSAHPLIASHDKRSIVCDDRINNKRRRLTPDCMGVMTNGRAWMIELDGPQHFRVIYHFNTKGSDLKSQITSDLAKNRYAVEHGMSLLRVAYTEYSDLEHWVNRFLDQCARTNSQVFLCSNPALYNGQRNIKLS